jgi:predicted secreted protein
MGASYEATCIALRRHGLIDAPTFSALCKVQPRTIKQQLLPDHKPEHWRRDVWVLTERDEGAVIEGQPDDLFLFRLNEKSGAGYLWDIGQLKQCGLVVVQDTRDIDQQFDLDATTVGDFVQRIITAQAEDAAIGEVRLALERPWNRSAEPAEQLHLRFDLRGKEQGLPRALRSQLNAA